MNRPTHEILRSSFAALCTALLLAAAFSALAASSGSGNRHDHASDAVHAAQQHAPLEVARPAKESVSALSLTLV